MHPIAHYRLRGQVNIKIFKQLIANLEGIYKYGYMARSLSWDPEFSIDGRSRFYNPNFKFMNYKPCSYIRKPFCFRSTIVHVNGLAISVTRAFYCLAQILFQGVLRGSCRCCGIFLTQMPEYKPRYWKRTHFFFFSRKIILCRSLHIGINCSQV